MPRLKWLLLFCVSAWHGGCAKHEFRILEPPEIAGRLTKQERRIEQGSIVLHLVDQSNRVGVRIENMTDEALTINSSESYVVAPNGRTDPIVGGAIAPRSWAATTIPPLITVFERSGVSFGMGVGSWGHGRSGSIGMSYDPFYDDVYLPQSEVAWKWKTGIVRLHLVIEGTTSPDRRSEHDFTIERRRIE